MRILSSKRHLLTLCLCTLTFGLLFSACDLFGVSLTDKKATPTTQGNTNTGTGSELTTYTGEGFSIGYPSDWKKTEKTNNAAGQNVKTVQFTDSTGLATFVISTMPNANGLIPANTVVDAIIAVSTNGIENTKSQSQPAATIGGQSWEQKSITGDATQGGQTVSVKGITLARNYPDSSSDTKLFTIVYTAPAVLFDTTDAVAFKPMLQSFKFA